MNFTLIIGWLLDLMFGDPERLPHPIVYFGKWISFGEHRLNKGTHRLAKGAVFVVLSVLLTFGVCWGVFEGLTLLYNIEGNICYRILKNVLGAVLVFFCLAGHTLRKEVRMVFEALDESLDAGRRQVARIVGRDTAELSAQEVRTASLETLAENLSDGVIAPLFWFAVLGVPGMLMYKMINTFDSMVGYQNERYRDFGCWAAHIDDIANYIPARITAFLMIVAASLYRVFVRIDCPYNFFQQIKFVIKYGPKHASPNSGWPEAALASILDCRFGGPHNYFGELFYKPYIGTNEKLLNTQDMKHSIRICLIAECLAIAVVVGTGLFICLQ